MRCYYEVLGVDRSADDDEIKRSYRKLALKWHPDKNKENLEEATNVFKELQNAYAVLSDLHERAWYDDHREAILRGDGNLDLNADIAKPGEWIYAYFSASCFDGYDSRPRGFFRVYEEAFTKIEKAELNAMDDKERNAVRHAPRFGSESSEWEDVRYFYAHWEAFATKLSFSEADEYDTRHADGRRIRRLMEKENRRARAKVQREYSEIVRNLVQFVRKRDPRVAEAAERARKEREEEEKRLKIQQEEERRARLEEKLQILEEASSTDSEEDREHLELLEMYEHEEKKKKKSRKKKNGAQYTPASSADEHEQSDAESSGKERVETCAPEPSSTPVNETRAGKSDSDENALHEDQVSNHSEDSATPTRKAEKKAKKNKKKTRKEGQEALQKEAVEQLEDEIRRKARIRAEEEQKSGVQPDGWEVIDKKAQRQRGKGKKKR